MVKLNTDLLKNTIDKISFKNGEIRHSGKVRESFVLDKNTRAIVVTDRVSAFDFILGTIPFKGQVLNQIAAWWFEKLDQIQVPHHFLGMPHPNISLVKNTQPLPVEFVVRGYLTGTTTTSSWYAYQHSERKICDIEMPAGMVKNQVFPEPILTPTTKPEVGHDRNISVQQIIDEGLVAPEIVKKAAEYALEMFAFGQKVAAEKGLILVDTKYEMGLTDEGELIIIDEVHTPDSSRYWMADSYESLFQRGSEPESLDKEFVRRMLVEAGYNVDDVDQDPKNFMTDKIRLAAAEKYLILYREITGEDLHLEAGDFTSDIERCLRHC